MGYLAFGERLTLISLAGMVLVAAGAALVNVRSAAANRRDG